MMHTALVLAAGMLAGAFALACVAVVIRVVAGSYGDGESP